MKTTVRIALAALLLAGSSVARGDALLNVAVESQEQSQWCWAACCQMVLEYYGFTRTQCEMADYAFGQSNCCTWGGSAACNQPNWLFDHTRDCQDVLIKWGSVFSVGHEEHFSWPLVTSEIDARRPFIIGWHWDGGGGHALVGRGYTDSNWVDYNDPGPDGYMKGLYSWMVSGGGHTWDETLRLTDYWVMGGGDYDGDGTSDFAVFRPPNGLWAIRGLTRYYFGTNGDIPVPGDYLGDGTTKIGIFRSASGLWSFRTPTHTYRAYFGGSGDRPVPADYDGDGTTNVAVYRPSSGLWAIEDVGRYYFGQSSDQPVPGLYDSAVGVEVAIFRPSTGLWALRSSGARGYFGRNGDIPVPGDYGGQGDWCAAIYRPSTGLWAAYDRTRCYFGSSSDLPAPGRFRGGGDEMTVFRPSTGLWAVRNSSRCYFGRGGDIPVTR